MANMQGQPIKRDVNLKPSKVIDLQMFTCGGRTGYFILENLTPSSSKYTPAGWDCYTLSCCIDISTFYPTMRFIRTGNNNVMPLSGDEYAMKNMLMQRKGVSKMSTYYAVSPGNAIADYKFSYNPQTGAVMLISLYIYNVSSIRTGNISCKYIALGVQPTQNIAEKISQAIQARGIMPHNFHR